MAQTRVNPTLAGDQTTLTGGGQRTIIEIPRLTRFRPQSPFDPAFGWYLVYVEAGKIFAQGLHQDGTRSSMGTVAQAWPKIELSGYDFSGKGTAPAGVDTFLAPNITVSATGFIHVSFLGRNAAGEHAVYVIRIDPYEFPARIQNVITPLCVAEAAPVAPATIDTDGDRGSITAYVNRDGNLVLMRITADGTVSSAVKNEAGADTTLAITRNGTQIVVVHTSDFEVVVERYDASTLAQIGTDIEITRPADVVNSTIIGDQIVNDRSASPSIAMLREGGRQTGEYVVVWSGRGDGDDQGVFLQRFDTDGNRIGPETRVNTITDGNQTDAMVVADEVGGYYVAWLSNHSTGTTDRRAVLALFDRDGVRQDEFTETVFENRLGDSFGLFRGVQFDTTAIRIVPYLVHPVLGHGHSIVLEMAWRGEVMATTRDEGAYIDEFVPVVRDQVYFTHDRSDGYSYLPGADGQMLNLPIWGINTIGEQLFGRMEGGERDRTLLNIGDDSAYMATSRDVWRSFSNLPTDPLGNESGPVWQYMDKYAYFSDPLLAPVQDGSAVHLYRIRQDDTIEDPLTATSDKVWPLLPFDEEDGFYLSPQLVTPGRGSFYDNYYVLDQPGDQHSIALAKVGGPASEGGIARTARSVVIWTKDDGGDGVQGIFGQLFDSRPLVWTQETLDRFFNSQIDEDGQVTRLPDPDTYPIGGETVLRGGIFEIAANGDEEAEASITALLDADGAPNGKFVVVFQSRIDATDDWDLYYRVFDTTSGLAVPLGDAQLLDTVTAGNQMNASVLAKEGGGFLVVYQSDAGGTYDVMARHFDVPDKVTITTLDTGQIAVAWQQPDGDGLGIWGAVLNADGSTAVSSFRISGTLAGDQTTPSIAALPGGAFMVSYTSPDGDGTGAFAITWRVEGSRAFLIGGETRLHDGTAGNQGDASLTPSFKGGNTGSGVGVAFTGSGDGQDVFFARLNAQGQLSPNNPGAPDGDQRFADVVALNEGRSAVVWRDAAGTGSVRVQIYTAAGLKEGAAIELGANAGALAPSITAQPDGSFAVVWQEADASNLRFVRVDAEGAIVQDRVLDPALGAFNQMGRPQIVTLGDGRFAVVWDEGLGDAPGTDRDVFARFLDADGVQVGGDIVIAGNPFGADDPERGAALAARADGGFVVAWTQEFGGNRDIVARLVAANGTMQAPFAVNATTLGAQTEAQVSVLGDGRLLFVWQSAAVDVPPDEGTPINVIRRIFAADGTGGGAEFVINTHTDGWQTLPDITPLVGGGFVAVWSSRNEVSGTSEEDIFAQIYDATGAKRGGPILVNVITEGEQSHAAVTALEDGGFIIAWHSEEPGGTGFDIFSQRYSPDGQPLTPQTAAVVELGFEDAAQFGIVAWEARTMREGPPFTDRNFLVASTTTGYRTYSVSNTDASDIQIIADYDFGTQVNGITLHGGHANAREFNIVRFGETGPGTESVTRFIDVTTDLTNGVVNVFELNEKQGTLTLVSSTKIPDYNGFPEGAHIEKIGDEGAFRVIYTNFPRSGDNAAWRHLRTAVFDKDGQFVEAVDLDDGTRNFWAGSAAEVDDGAGGSVRFYVAHQWNTGNLVTVRMNSDGTLGPQVFSNVVPEAGGGRLLYDFKALRIPAAGTDKTWLYAAAGTADNLASQGLNRFEVKADGTIAFVDFLPLPGMENQMRGQTFYVDGNGKLWGSTARHLLSFNDDGTFDVVWQDLGVDRRYHVQLMTIDGRLNRAWGYPQSIKIYDTGVLSGDPAAPVCFVRGTRIRTARGEVRIEDLRPGDLIATLDAGLQPLRWIGSSRIAGRGRFAPVLVESGTLGNREDLFVSPQHRILLQGWRAEILSGHPQVLAAAIDLVNGGTIRQVQVAEVEYFHILFDAHQIVWSNGIPSESLHVSRGAVASLPSAQRAELQALFPGLFEEVAAAQVPAARATLRPYEARILADLSLA
jgi:hypothetical protein